RVRVLTLAERYPDRRAFQLVALAEEILQIALVSRRDVLGAGAVDHDGRWIGAAGMRETQLRRMAVDQWRLVALVGCFQRLGEIGRDQHLGRRGMRTYHRTHQFAQARTVQRRDVHLPGPL